MPENEIIVNNMNFQESMAKYRESFLKKETFTLTFYKSFPKVAPATMMKQMRTWHAVLCDDDIWNRRKVDAADKVSIIYNIK